MDKYVEHVVEQITKLINVKKIILFSKKQDLNGETSSFKICVITNNPNPNIKEYEKIIYINVDSDIPFDVVIYSNDDWEKHIGDAGSFCNKVNGTGSVIYE